MTENPFGKHKELTHLFLMAKSGKTFKKSRPVSSIFGLSDICPYDYQIEDVFLHYGIPYSQLEKDILKINIPKFFENQYLEQTQLFKGKLYEMILNEYRKRKTNENPNRIFKMLMGYAFYKILEISPNENAPFIKEEIDGGCLFKSFKINHFPKISAKNHKISTNLKTLFNNIKRASLNFPNDLSYGFDAMISLPLKFPVYKLKRIFIGFQMKNYFSGKTKLSEKEIWKEIKKMKNIMKHMDKRTRKKYKTFYYVIICPTYCEEVLKNISQITSTIKNQ